MGIFSSNQVKSNANSLFPQPNPLCSALAPSLTATSISQGLSEGQHHSLHRLLPTERFLLWKPFLPFPARLLGWLSLPLPHACSAPAPAFRFAWQVPVPHRKTNENQGSYPLQSIWKSSCCTIYLILSTSIIDQVISLLLPLCYGL